MRRYLTISQLVAEREFATERLIRRLISERRIPYAKPANRILIALEDFDAFIEASRVETRPIEHLRRGRPLKRLAS